MSKFWASSDSSSTQQDESNDNTNYGAEDTVSQHIPLEFEAEAGHCLACDPNAIWEEIRDKQLFVGVPSIPVTSTFDRRMNSTRLVIISDTHGQHRNVHLPKGDILIHAGDFTKTGEVGTIQDLSRYFEESGFAEVVVIAGNHDMTLDPEYYQRKWQRFHRIPHDCQAVQAAIEQNCHYLKDSTWTSLSGLNFYGSPFSPDFFDWAFNRPRGPPIRQVWDKIPSQEELPLDILITHTPPLGRGDLTQEFVLAGCYDLLQSIQTRIKPRVNIFGHIHEGYGTSFDGQTLFVNASSLDVRYQPIHRPIVVDVSHADKAEPAHLVEPVNTYATTKLELERWCMDHGYNVVTEALKKCDDDDLPLGNDLLKANALSNLLEKLCLHYSKEGQKELRDMLGKLYAESF
ncbi:metallophosphoesterase domain containing protein [Nitzschia inconspicua]|uniref:Metallophosphoesterase domain containing protein n=1 Tax=Nitzschia inconspicua TaxID=303405 RepID=A0A9K3KUD9_9STRA|nr:metallophosphoesterase domain containing protein [Nitzschia inconspicua]